MDKLFFYKLIKKKLFIYYIFNYIDTLIVISQILEEQYLPYAKQTSEICLKLMSKYIED